MVFTHRQEGMNYAVFAPLEVAIRTRYSPRSVIDRLRVITVGGKHGFLSGHANWHFILLSSRTRHHYTFKVLSPIIYQSNQHRNGSATPQD